MCGSPARSEPRDKGMLHHAATIGLTVQAKRRSIAICRRWRQIASKGGFDDSTSAEQAAYADGTRSDHRIAAKNTNGTPG